MLVGLDWTEPMMNLFLHVTCSCILMHRYLQFYILLYQLLGAFLIVSLSFFLSLPLMLVASWHLSVSLLRSRTLFVPGHLLLILPPFTFSSVMRRPVQTSWRTFLDEAFIRNAKSSYRIFPILTFSLSSTVGVRSHFVASRSLVPP